MSRWLSVGRRLLAAAAVGFGGVGLSVVHATEGGKAASSNLAAICPADSDKLPDNLLLKNVAVFFRHGARTPFNDEAHIVWDVCSPHGPAQAVQVEPVHKLDGSPAEHLLVPYAPAINGGPCFPAQLTTVGQQQAVELGALLRKKYIEETQLLSPDHSEKDITVRSSNTNRTVQTAQGVLSGLYPHGTARPVKVLVLPEHEEYLFPNCRRCPRLLELQEASQSIFYEGYARSMAAFKQQSLDALSTLRSGASFIGIRDVVVARKAHGLTTPDLFLDENFFAQLDQIAARELAHEFFHDVDYTDLPQGTIEKVSQFEISDPKAVHKEAMRLAVGACMSDVLQRFENAARGVGTKVGLFATHDNSLMAMLQLFGVYENHWPQFAASVSLELYEDKNKPEDHFVRLLYNNKPVRLPHCAQAVCPLSEFRHHLSAFIPTDPVAECRRRSPPTGYVHYL